MAEVPEREEVEIVVDGRRYQAPEGYNLHLWLNDQGFEIPYFCNHEKLEPTGACRMCLVRVGDFEEEETEEGETELSYDWQPNLEASCTMTVRPGLAVDTEHPSVEQNQKEQVEFHLINHPLECPTCDKGGECQLQDWTYKYGRGEGRFKEQKREVPDSHINEFIRMNYKRCILCKRCVRFHKDIAKDDLMEFAHRGYGSVLFSFPHHSGRPQSKFSGNSVDICPVGAVTSKVFRFRGRPWEFTRTPTVDCFDSGGTNVEVHHRKGLIMRTWPRDNKEVDYGWITDKTRFAYEFVHSEARSDYSMIRDGDEWNRTDTSEAIDSIADQIDRAVAEHGPDSVAIMASSVLTNEELFYLRRLVEEIGTENFYFGDLIDFEPELRDEAVETMLTCGESVHGVATCDTIFQFGCDILEEIPVQGLFFERIQREQPINKTISANPCPADFEREAIAVERYAPGRAVEFIERLEEKLEAEDTEGELGGLVERLLESNSVGIVYGDHVLNSDNPGAQVLALRHLQQTLQDILSEKREDYDRVTLTPVLQHGNSMGAMAIGHMGLIDGESTNQPALREFGEELAGGEVRVLVNFGRDLIERLPDRKRAKEILDTVDFVASCDMFLHESNQRGDLHVATDTFLEKDGTYLSSFNRLQRLQKSDLKEGRTIPEFDIIIRLLEDLAEGFVYHGPEDALASLAERWGVGTDNFRALGDKGKNVDFAASPPEGKLSQLAGEPDEGITLVPKRFMFDHEPMARFSEHFLDAVREPEAWISTRDAARLGLERGARIKVKRDGEFIELIVRPKPDIPAGTLVAPKFRVDQPLNKLQELGTTRPEVEVEEIVEAPEPEEGRRVADPLGEFV